MVWLGAEPPPGYEHLVRDQAGPKTYTLKEGDTLFSVARKFGVHYDKIAQANGIVDLPSVGPGQTLIIPAPDWEPGSEPEREAEAVPPAQPVDQSPTKPTEVTPAVEVEMPPAEPEAPDWLFEESQPDEAPVLEEKPVAVTEDAGQPVEMVEVQPEAATALPPKETAPAVEIEPEPPAPAEMVFRYEIQRGDTFNGIARRYGLTLKELVDANNITDPNRIFPGQKLIIPGYQLPKPQPEPESMPAPLPPIPGPDQHFLYTIVSGDTLNTIAKRYSITVRELIEANNIDNPNMLRIGQKLIIPGVFRPAAPMPPPNPLAPLGPANAVRGFYISYFAIGHPESRQRIFELLEHTELNTVVIDIKGEHGWLSYPSQVPLAREIGAVRPTAKDFQEFVADLKAQKVYTIARVVTFKDAPLAKAYPELAVKTSSGATWQDRENMGWLDPFLKPAWDYNIQIAVEAAQMGFDEILFDSLRFPMASQAGEPQFSQEINKDSRVAAIAGFLSVARGQLNPLGVKLAAKTFGYTCWRKDDMLIGQDIERMAQYLDVLSPMLYPSTFDNGIPGYELPVAHPYEVVYESARRAVSRVNWLGCTVRPWIQDFQDYRFDRRVYGPAEIQAQIKGCFDAGCDGYLAWNPQLKYSTAAYATVAAMS
jgi:nucleoid-associated protein YgaU